MCLAGVQTACYFSYLLYFVHVFHRKYKLRFPIFYYLIASTALIGTNLTGFGFYLNAHFVLALGTNFICAATIMVFLFSARYPKFLISMKEYIEDKNYEISLLSDVHMNSVEKRITSLMEERKLYLDENLKLHQFAEELLISPRQLSSILNRVHGQNFNDFINLYRIEEAKKQLREEKDKKILNIAFDVGFNTKSTFNLVFHKLVNMTPQQFRSKN